MEIRKATQDDFEKVQAMSTALLKHEFDEYEKTWNVDWPKHEDGVKWIDERLSSDTSFAIVAEEDGKIVGFLLGWLALEETWRTVKMAELEHIFVHDGYRGKGIGGSLVDRFLEWAKSQGAKRCKLPMLAKNTDARRFYERMGFFDHIVLMEKEL